MWLLKAVNWYLSHSCYSGVQFLSKWEFLTELLVLPWCSGWVQKASVSRDRKLNMVVLRNWHNTTLPYSIAQNNYSHFQYLRGAIEPTYWCEGQKIMSIISPLLLWSKICSMECIHSKISYKLGETNAFSMSVFTLCFRLSLFLSISLRPRGKTESPIFTMFKD